MDDLLYASTRSVAEAIREKRVSSAEMVEASLRRIEEVNPGLNAVVQLCAERALKEAGEADAALSRGATTEALHGVPMVIKDNLDTEGIITTGGTVGRKGFVPDEDATVVARLRNAGAILMGKTNTPELTLSFQTDNLVYGATNNPYDTSRNSGGSSGGAAAIVAAGGAPFDIGSDTGGSIRYPSHCCGVTGIKPTSGRTPRTGHILPPGGILDSLTQFGPIARYVEDLSLILPIISGVDWQDPAVVPMPLGDPGDVNIKSLRVAVHTDNGIVAPTPEIVEAVQGAAKALSDAGVLVEEARPEALERTNEIANILFDIGSTDFRAIMQRWGTTRETSSRKSIWDTSLIPHGEITEAILRWDVFRADMIAFMESYDVILCPANALPALAQGQSRDDDDPGYSYTTAYNLTGWPGVVVRGGTSPEGLPLGVQIVARPWREDVALAVAQHLENALGGWVRPPV